MALQKLTLGAAVTAILAACGGTSDNAGTADEAGMEKCYGIVSAGMNDCAANGHACAGQAVRDRDPNEWLTVPSGTCKRIAGGVVKKDAPTG